MLLDTDAVAAEVVCQDTTIDNCAAGDNVAKFAAHNVGAAATALLTDTHTLGDSCLTLVDTTNLVAKS